MSAFAHFADSSRTSPYVREVPCVDGSELARLLFTFCRLVGAAMCSAYCAAHKAAGHNALRGSGPGQKRAMHWHMWVVLIARSPALHYVLFALPTFTSRQMSARSWSCRKCDGFLVAITPSHNGPRHSCDLDGERDGGDLGRPARQQCCKPRPPARPS